MKNLGLLLIAVFLLLNVACTHSSHDSSSDSGGGLEPAAISGHGESCEAYLKKLPANYYYNWVSVPEDYEHPETSPKIKVFYYGPNGNFDSYVVFFNGGPGFDSHYNYELFDKSFQTFALPTNKVGFVYIDQRGTGCSSRYPSGTTDADILRLRFYGSTGIVHDAESVRQALGLNKWKVFGQSYGAFIVHRYVTLFPNSISDAYAHGNAITSSAFERLLDRIYSQHKVLELFLAVYPEDREHIKILKSFLENHSDLCVKDKYNQSYCGLELAQLLIESLGFSDTWATLHFRITKATPEQNGEITVDVSYFKTLVNRYAEPPPSSSYMNSVLSYYDRNVAGVYTDTCSQIFATIQKRYGLSEADFLISECSGAMQYTYSGKKRDQVIALYQAQLNPSRDILTLADFTVGLKKLGSSHFFLYSGERDPFLPENVFSEELSAVGKMLTYRHFPNSGHEGFFTEKRVLEDVLN